MNTWSWHNTAARACLGATLWACAFLSTCGEANSSPNYPTGQLEKKYYADGPWAVKVEIGADCCDSKGNSYDYYYPANLGAGGFLHPIIAWGNGTFGTSSEVAYFLKHMASWGFVIIATQDRFTYPGGTILDSVTHAVQANGDAGILHGQFLNKLDVNQIGAIGHSQGAGAAARAMIKSGGLIKTLIAIELPGQQFCFCPPADVLDTSQINNGSVFFVDGSLDLPVSPPTQPPSATGLQSIAAFYNAVPNNVPKLKGTLIGPTHNDITGQPSCETAALPCFNGVYGYLGYPTAWMRDQLQGDILAHGAFVQGTGEMFGETKNWEFVDSNIQ
jgi:hypothetical protein